MSFNTFRGEKTKGVFVYGLIDNDTIFYVGITGGNLAYRYRQHFSDSLICGHYIYKMRLAGRYPGIKIFGIFDGPIDAECAEHSVIRCLSLLGVKLCNKHQNPFSNYIKCDRPNYSDKPKRMPANLANIMVEQAIKEYNEFRQWEPYKVSSYV